MKDTNMIKKNSKLVLAATIALAVSTSSQAGTVKRVATFATGGGITIGSLLNAKHLWVRPLAAGASKTAKFLRVLQYAGVVAGGAVGVKVMAHAAAGSCCEEEGEVTAE
jgi:hypothetical protein